MSDPVHPAELATHQTYAGAYRVVADDGIAYMAYQTEHEIAGPEYFGLEVVDARDTTDLQRVSTLSEPWNAFRVELVDELAYIVSGPGCYFPAPDPKMIRAIYRDLTKQLPCPPERYWGRR